MTFSKMVVKKGKKAGENNEENRQEKILKRKYKKIWENNYLKLLM